MTETIRRPAAPVHVVPPRRPADEVREALERFEEEGQLNPGRPRQRSWLDERLGVTAFNQKYGRKAFPVHTTFFFGEMATFSFIILVVTGVYLGLIYIPSSSPVQYLPPNAPADYQPEELPEAYASVRLIESIPVANLFRNVHHWAAHVMVISTLLHTLRIYFYGAYRKPRELNWVFGVVLLILTLLVAFVGYSLPYDSYAVTATSIGYSIARSIPGIGDIAAELFFGGAFPTLGSLPRLYTLHIFVLPALITGAMAAHLLLVIKSKHTQPGYARRLAEPGRVLGVPLWPYQALLAGQLFMLMFGALFLVSAFLPIHPLAAYGPPGPNTPEVKPDWYLLWTYGFLKLVPGISIPTPIGTINSEFVGGLVFPGLIFGILTLVPWLDRTNRGRYLKRFEYLEPPSQAPFRLALGVAFCVFLLTQFLAAFYDEPQIGLSLAQMWFISLVVPLVAGGLAFGWAKWKGPDGAHRFDPTGEDAVDPAVEEPTRYPSSAAD
jgi:cytochrome b-561